MEPSDPQTEPLLPAEQAPGTGQRTVYTPADFTRFAPRNALQMLQNVPGFRVESESQERGLGQASGNVLINGQRPSSKSDSINSLLSRVPAANVVRIEIVDGSTLNIPGLSGQVANVITRSGGVRGRFEWRPQVPLGGPAPLRWSQGDASVSGKAGRLDYSVAVRNESFYNGSEGPSLIVANGVSDPRFNTTRSTLDSPKLSATLRYDLGGTARANLDISGGFKIQRSDELESRTLSNLPAFLKSVDSGNDGHNYEVSGDVEFPVGPGRLKLIALDSAEHGDFSTESRFSNAGRNDTGSQFLKGSDEGERIARGEYRWRMFGGDAQLSFEGAFNRLDNVASLFTLNTAGEFVELPFPAGTGGVREARYESILSYSRSLNSHLSLQVAGGAEYSKISQTGSNALARAFKRPKGSLTLAWAAGDKLDVSLRAARKVGQLNFSDFLASVSLTDGNANAGNNELRPPQSWEFELEVSRNFGAWGSATAKLFHYLIEDYVTIIPIVRGTSIGESRGNVPTATDTGINLNATLRLDPIGMKGAKFDVRALVDRSRLVDPVSGLDRGFDRAKARELQVDFRYDIPKTDWAWGATYRNSVFLPYYRVTEQGFDYSLARFAAVFIENKDVFGLTLNVRAANLFNAPSILDRSVYGGPRTTAGVLFTERRDRRSGRILQATVSGSF
ncbi:MAG: TonB-dependent receptor plug domain-containing protein [Croceibacterium sp.]